VRRRGRTLTVESKGLDELDLYVNGRPGGASITLNGDGKRRVQVPAHARAIELVGVSSGMVRQRRRLTISNRS
jgi:hypothetical protein